MPSALAAQLALATGPSALENSIIYETPAVVRPVGLNALEALSIHTDVRRETKERILTS